MYLWCGHECSTMSLGLVCPVTFALLWSLVLMSQLSCLFESGSLKKKCPSNSTLDMSWISTDKWRNTEVSFVCFFFFFWIRCSFQDIDCCEDAEDVEADETCGITAITTTEYDWAILNKKVIQIYEIYIYIIEGSLEVKLPTIWTDEKQSRAEAERRERSEERRVEEKE